MSKKFKICVVFALLFGFALASPFSCLFYKTKANVKAEELQQDLTLFIRKPLYCVYYDANEIDEKLGNIYFIDAYDNILKVYNVEEKTFETNFKDVSDYEFISFSYLDGKIYALVSGETNNSIIQITLSDLSIEVLDIEVSNDYDSFAIQNVTFNETDYLLFTFNPKDSSINPLLMLYNLTLSDIENTIEISFDTTQNDMLELKNNLIKVFAIQTEDDNLFILYVYSSTISYSTISGLTQLTDLASNEITTTRNLSTDLDTTNSSKEILNINFINIDSDSYIYVTYHDKNEDQDYIKLYNYTLGSETSKLTYKEDFQCENGNSVEVSNNVFIYYENQTIYYVSINSELESDKTSIDNPDLEITLFETENFVYKSTNKQTALLKNPWNFDSIKTINEGLDVINIGSAKIKDSTQINDYDYCLFTNNNKNYVGFIAKTDLDTKQTITVEDSQYKTIVTITSGAVLYTIPTTVSDVINIDETTSLTAKKIIDINTMSKIEVVDVICNYKFNTNTYMIKVKVNEDDIGFIDTKYIVNPSQSIDFLKTNATIQKDGTCVYLSADDSGVIQEELNAGKKVKIIGIRDTKTGFTQIKYNDQYGNVITGYVLTDYVKADAWSSLQIIGCVLVAVNIGLLILILVYRNKHLGKRGQNVENQNFEENKNA